MPFKIKDLMINIAPSEQAERTDAGEEANAGGCLGRHTDIVGCLGKRTNVAACIGKHTDATGYAGYQARFALPCGRCTQKSPKPVFSPACGPGEILEELSLIKAQLQLELAEVNDEIREIEDTLQPKTVADVEVLEAKLEEALEELGRIKADIERK